MKYSFVTNSSIFLLLLLFSTGSGKAQTSYSAEVEVGVFGAKQEKLPFWMYSNKRGRISPETSFLGLVQGQVVHQFSSGSILEIGAGGLIHDGFEDELALDEAYARFVNEHFYITAGVKQREELYNGLSASNENILWSLNARPLPGVEIGTTEPIFILDGVGFEASWAEYVLEKDRHVAYARVHHKSLHLVYMPNESFIFKGGIRHFAQWGGTSSTEGKQPTGFTDYLRIFTGREGGETAIIYDQANALGNHLGSWEISAQKEFEAFSISLLFNSLFEDGSGSRMANLPDGRYGIFLGRNDPAGLVNSLMYEFYFTRDQSGTGPHLYDDYLNNWPIYNSGWTYKERVLGAPFFWYDEGKDRIVNNKFFAHHLAIAGNFGSPDSPLPYRLLATYSQNEGTYREPLQKRMDIYSLLLGTRLYTAALDGEIPQLRLDLQLAADFNNLLDPNFGAGISLKYEVGNTWLEVRR